MLTLLSPQSIEQDKNGTANEIQRRVWGLAEEESRLVSSVNSLRLEEKLAKEKTQNMQATDEAAYLTRKGILRGEVEELERRRSVALQPVNKLLAEAKQYLESNQIESDNISLRSQAIAKRENDIKDQEERIIKREDEFTDAYEKKTYEMKKREAGIDAAEAEIKRQTKTLSEQWIEYHTALSTTNEFLGAREVEIRTDTKINLTLREELNKREAALNERERGITDKYNSLIAATKEFEQKNGNHSKKRF